MPPTVSERDQLVDFFHCLSPDAQAAALVYGVVEPHVCTAPQVALILRHADIRSDGLRLRSVPATGMMPLERVLDAYGGLKYLAALPYVNRYRVGVIGWSHGGAVALSSLLIANEGFYWS